MPTSSADAPEPEGRDAATVSAIAAGVLGLALTMGAFAFGGPRAALSVGAGATIAVANLVAMSAIVRRVLQPADDLPTDATPKPELDLDADLDARANAELAAEGAAEAEEAAETADPVDHAAEGKRGGAAWGAFGLGKILFLFGGIYLLLTRRMVDPMPLVLGYGVLPLGIAASSLFTSLSPRSSRKPKRSRPTSRN
jgi:hypothetical protein